MAALTKIGGWSSHILLEAADLVRVPESLDPAEAETFVVNGATGVLHAQVAARIPLSEAARALELAESGTVTGKVVIVPA
ncbi:zinc-binding dehydrogenase [Nocardia sp. NPDC127526]|uniref:zinc-binding dehydrogenase n=1 Tax=Nocardia sp. NPDC127526 TaxID=3345393 RepID=UPI0036459369